MIRSPAGFDGGDRIKRYLDYYQPSYGVMMLSAGQFSPASLFAAGEQGAWYDPSDFTTMFQDSAGTTPVTAVEQPVGLLLDKSKGLALGAELISGVWSNSGTLPFDTFSASGSGFSATKSIAGTQQQAYLGSFSVTAGRYYYFELAVSANTISASLLIDISTATTGRSNQILVPTGASTVKGYFSPLSTQATANLRILTTSAATGSVSITSATVRELPGNHARQSTPASCPVLSARVNLLTYSEQFDNAAWTKASASVTTGTTSEFTAPDGTTNADKLIVANAASGGRASQTFTLATSPHTFSVCGKAGEWSWLVLSQGAPGSGQEAYFNLSSGTVGTVGAPSTATITNLGNGWYRCSLTFTASGLSSTYRIIPTNADNTTSTGDGTSGIYIWGADVRVTNVGVNLPAYQRVAAATDYDTNGFPLYLKFDGVDDSLATGTIDPGAVDKAQVFAGVRKLSDDIDRCLVEIGANANTTNGSFALFAPAKISGSNIGKYLGALRGTAASLVELTTYTAPTTNTLAAQYDIAGASIASESIYRVNGSAPTETTNGIQAGTGNFGSLPLNIGRRNGATLPLNANLYSLIVRFSAANLSDAQIASTETWVNGKTKAY